MQITSINQVGRVISSHGLERHGLRNLKGALWNFSTGGAGAKIRFGAARASWQGAARSSSTPANTPAASPNDKFIVQEPGSEGKIWWGEVNRPITPPLRGAFTAQDVCLPPGPRSLSFRTATRVPIPSTAWRSGSSPRMPGTASSPGTCSLPRRNRIWADFEPQFTVIDAPTCQADPEHDGTNSGVFIIVDFAERLVLIGGTSYAGRNQEVGLFGIELPAARGRGSSHA